MNVPRYNDILVCAALNTHGPLTMPKLSTYLDVPNAANLLSLPLVAHHVEERTLTQLGTGDTIHKFALLPNGKALLMDYLHALSAERAYALLSRMLLGPVRHQLPFIQKLVLRCLETDALERNLPAHNCQTHTAAGIGHRIMISTRRVGHALGRLRCGPPGHIFTYSGLVVRHGRHRGQTLWSI